MTKKSVKPLNTPKNESSGDPAASSRCRLPWLAIGAVLIGAFSFAVARLIGFRREAVDTTSSLQKREQPALPSRPGPGIYRHFCGSRRAPLACVADSLLDDGVFDCCDGSDEPGSHDSKRCIDDAAQAAHELRDIARAHDAGLQAANLSLAAFLPRKDAAVALKEAESSKRKADSAAAALEKLRAKVSKLQASLQKKAASAGSSQHKLAAEFSSLQRAHQEMVQATAAAAAAARFAELAESGGAAAAALVAAAPCAQSSPVSEKDSKGGSTTSVPKRYAVRACFAGGAAQIEYLPDEWNRADAATKEGAAAAAAGGKSKASSKKKAALPNRTWADGPTSLGTWIGFVPLELAGQQFSAGIVGYPGVGVPARDLMNAYNMLQLNGGATAAVADSSKLRRAGLTDAAIEAAIGLTRHVTGRWPSSASTGTGTSREADAPLTSLHDVVAVYMDANGPLCRSEDVESPRRVHVLHTCPGVPRPGQALRSALLAAAHAHSDTTHSDGATTADAGSATTEAGASTSIRVAAAERAARTAILRRALLVGGPDELSLERFSPRQWNSEGALAEAEAAAAKALAAARAGGKEAAQRKALAAQLWPAIVHAEEDGLCAYRMWVATPLACSADVAAAARAEADALAAEYGL